MPIHTRSELSSDSDSAYDSASVASVNQPLLCVVDWDWCLLKEQKKEETKYWNGLKQRVWSKRKLMVISKRELLQTATNSFKQTKYVKSHLKHSFASDTNYVTHWIELVCFPASDWPNILMQPAYSPPCELYNINVLNVLYEVLLLYFWFCLFSCTLQETVCLCVYEVNDDTSNDLEKTLVAKVGCLFLEFLPVFNSATCSSTSRTHWQICLQNTIISEHIFFKRIKRSFATDVKLSH